jgi:hypothetical protein
MAAMLAFAGVLTLGLVLVYLIARR